MRYTLETPQPLHDIVLLYLSVIDAGSRDPHERQVAIELARQWAPIVAPDAIEAVIDTAYAAARSGLAADLETLAEGVRDRLPSSACQQLLSDLGLLARADGHLTKTEARAIARVRTVFSRTVQPQTL